MNNRERENGVCTSVGLLPLVPKQKWILNSFFSLFNPKRWKLEALNRVISPMPAFSLPV